MATSVIALPSVDVDIIATNNIETRRLSLSTQPLTGYTNTLTPFTFYLDTSYDSSLLKITDQSVIWEWGDGTSTVGNSATHVYETPGRYTVEVSFLDQNGKSRSSIYTQNVVVKNIIPDKISWDSPGMNNCHIDRVRAGAVSEQLTVKRYNSWQSYKNHKTGYTVNLYASGSLSRPANVDTFQQTKYVHFQPLWRFIKEANSETPINKVTIPSTLLYYKLDGTTAVPTTSSDSDGVFVGTYGTNTVHYIDDVPRNLQHADEPVLLFAVQDTSKFNDNSTTKSLNDKNLNRSPELNYMQTQKGVLPIKVLYNRPTQLVWTENGIQGFGLSKVKYHNTQIPYVISLADNVGNHIKSVFPPLSADFDVTEDYYIEHYLNPPANNWFFLSRNLGIRTPGSYVGFFSACNGTQCDLSDTIKMQGYCYVREPSFVNEFDINFAIIPDGDLDYIHRVKRLNNFPLAYSYYNGLTITSTLSNDDLQATSIDTGLTQSVGSNYVGINSRGFSWIANSQQPVIHKISPCSVVVSSISLSTYNPIYSGFEVTGLALDNTDSVVLSLQQSTTATYKDGYIVRFADNGNMSMTYNLSTIVDCGSTLRSLKFVDTDQLNNIWATVYCGTTAHHSAIYFVNSGAVDTTCQLPPISSINDIVATQVNQLFVTYEIGATSSGVFHLSSGTIINTISSTSINYDKTFIDKNGTLWFVANSTYVSSYSPRAQDNVDIATPNFGSNILGIDGDPFGNIHLIHSGQYKVFVPSLTTVGATISSTGYTLSTLNIGSMAAGQTYGDWTGWRYTNKFGYNDALSARIVEGSSDSFYMLPPSGCNSFAKFNENFDLGATVQSYVLQDNINTKNVFMDMLIEGLSDVNDEPTCFGKTIYEKIANYPANISDVSTCNVKALYSLAKQVGVELEDYQYQYPAQIQRLMSTLSINKNKLFGDRNKYDTDFNKKGFPQTNTNYGINLGNYFPLSTYTVSAGVPIIARELFNNGYTKIDPFVLPCTHLDGTTAIGDTYSPYYNGLTSYPLSAYDPFWGWGLSYPTNEPLQNHYKFYHYIDRTENSQTEGVINWSDQFSTIDEEISYTDWTKQHGPIDLMLHQQLREGLGLYVPCITGNAPPAIVNLTAKYGSVYLSWNELDTYRYLKIYRSIDQGATWRRYKVIRDQGITEFRDSSFSTPGWYYYRVSSVNRFGETFSTSPSSVGIYVPSDIIRTYESDGSEGLPFVTFAGELLQGF